MMVSHRRLGTVVLAGALLGAGFVAGRASAPTSPAAEAPTSSPAGSVPTTVRAPAEPTAEQVTDPTSSTSVVPSTTERVEMVESASLLVAGDQPPTPPSVGGKAFFESFESMGWGAFRTGVFHRDVDAHGFPLSDATWPGDHDLACGPPSTKRTLSKSDRSSSFYVCNPGPSGTNHHGMTSVGHVDSYSVAWFSPKETFSSISEVCWDVNISTDVLGHRQWWEVMVAPVGAPDVTAISWLAGTANLPNYGAAGAVVLGFGPDNPPHAKLSVGNDVVGRVTTNDPEGRNDVRPRRPHCLEDNGDGTITYSTVNGDGSAKSMTASGSFPAGELKVVFKDHNYTPDKDCGERPCDSYTWHWDNIAVRN